MYHKKCSICGKKFDTDLLRKNICSWECRQEANRRNSLRISRIKRSIKKEYEPCEICGFSLLTQTHHDYDGEHILCPNHHLVITRGIKTLDQLIRDKTLDKI